MSENDEKVIPPLKIGDVVRLKSGGPWMTIESEPEHETLIECVWFGNSDGPDPACREFPWEALEVRNDARISDADAKAARSIVADLDAQLDKTVKSLSAKHVMLRQAEEDLETANARITELEAQLAQAKSEADLMLNNTLDAIQAEIRAFIKPLSAYAIPPTTVSEWNCAMDSALEVLNDYRIKEPKPCV
jgi:uncharacterized protein YodC (DUF2158 family)